MTRFPRVGLAGVALTLSLLAPQLALSQERDDFLDDFLPDAPLQPLDNIVTDPDPDDWADDILGDPGELAPLDPVAARSGRRRAAARRDAGSCTARG